MKYRAQWITCMSYIFYLLFYVHYLWEKLRYNTFASIYRVLRTNIGQSGYGLSAISVLSLSLSLSIGEDEDKRGVVYNSPHNTVQNSLLTVRWKMSFSVAVSILLPCSSMFISKLYRAQSLPDCTFTSIGKEGRWIFTSARNVILLLQLSHAVNLSSLRTLRNRGTSNGLLHFTAIFSPSVRFRERGLFSLVRRFF